MIKLPEAPRRIALLPKDVRGYPVPWFVHWFKDGQPSKDGEGEPDFRVIGPRKMVLAHKHGRCWICGQTITMVNKCYVIGPMCVVNRVTSEPGSHRECAEYAATACPFLVRPRQKRDTKDMVEGGKVAGIHLDRNPGACAVYETRHVKPFQAGDGVLFQLGEPKRIDWYSQGRTATRAEILDSIVSGMPHLTELAEKEGVEAVMELGRMTGEAMKLLPAE